jgi:hypothetical protein
MADDYIGVNNGNGWKDSPSTDTPRNAKNFNIMEAGIKLAHTLIKALQNQINQIVKTGDSSVEAAQARVEADGTVNATLKARLDKKESLFSSELAAKATYYNAVADMLADITLKSGDRCVTLGYYSTNDGGGAKYKIVSTIPDRYYEIITDGLYAELIVDGNTIKASQLGARHDTSDDQASKLLYAITYCLSNDIDLIIDGDYVTTTPIKFYGINSKIYKGKVHQTGTITFNSTDANAYALTIASVHYLKWDGIRIHAPNSSGLLFTDATYTIDGTKINGQSFFNIINIKDIYAKVNGLEIYTESHGVANNRITFNMLCCDNYNIYMHSPLSGDITNMSLFANDIFCNSTQGYAAELTTPIQSKVGLYIDGSGEVVAHNNIYNLHVETADIGIYLGHCSDMRFYGMHTEEQDSRTSTISVQFNDGCYNAAFYGSLLLGKININSNSATAKFFGAFTIGERSLTSGRALESSYKLSNGAITPLESIIATTYYLNISHTINTPIGTDYKTRNVATIFYPSAAVDNLYLNKKVYNPYGVNKIMVKKSTGYLSKIYYDDGILVKDLSSFANNVWVMLEFVNFAVSPTDFGTIYSNHWGIVAYELK